MKKVLSAFVNMYNSIYKYISDAYTSSKTKVINDAVVSSALSASSNSFICRFLSNESRINELFDRSLISKVWMCILAFFKGIIAKIFSLFEKSVIFNSCGFFADNILNIPLNLYGTFLISFSLPAIVYMCFEEVELVSVSVYAVSLILGVFLAFTKASFNRVLFSSKVFKVMINTMSADPFAIDDFDKKSVVVGKSVYFLLCVTGVLLGVSGLFITPYIVLIGLCALIGIMMVLYNFAIGVYITILCFPFLPTMAVVGLLMLSLFSLVIRYLSDDSFTFKRTGLDIYIILFALIIGISGITSFDRSTSINIALVYIVFILSYFAFTNTIRTKKDLSISLSMLIAGGIVVSLIGIYQYIFGFSGGNVWIDSDMFSEIETRVVSTFENPNVLGEYLLIIIPVAIAYFFESGSLKEKWASLFAAGILVLCMIFTFSRGCWIGMIVSFGILSLFYDRRFVWAGFILILFAPLYLPESIIQRFMSVGNTTDTSTSYRVYIWFGTIDMLKDYWLTGIGLGEGAFNVIYPHYSYSAIVAPHSHNLYLQIMVENGIVGFVLFAVMTIAFYRNAISSLVRIKKGFLKVCLLSLLSAVTGYLIQGLFDNVWYNYRVFMFFFMALAITMQCGNIALENELKSRGDSVDQCM